MSTAKEKLYRWLIDHVAYNNTYYIDELAEYVTINETPIYRGFDVIETDGDKLFVKNKSFSQSYDVAYDFAQMSFHKDCCIVEIDAYETEVINVSDVYNDLRSEFSFTDNVQSMILNEKEVLTLNDWIRLALVNEEPNLTSATIYNFKGDFIDETTEETTFV